MNQSKKNRKDYHSFQHKVAKNNNRRVKLNKNRTTDNIFISGPVQYQPDPQPLIQSNFVHATTTNHHKHSSRQRNAWGTNPPSSNSPKNPINKANKLSNANQSQIAQKQSQSIPNLTHPKKSKMKSKQSQAISQSNIAPIPRKDEEFPALTSPKPITSHTKAQTSKKDSKAMLEHQSSWLQYDNDPIDGMEDYDSNGHNANGNSNNHGSLTNTPRKQSQSQSHPSLHDNVPSTNNDSSQTHQNNNDRFPHNYNRYDTQPQRHQNSTRQYQSRRDMPNNAINIDPYSFQRQRHGNDNGYYNDKHAAVLDGFDTHNRDRNAQNKPRKSKRRYTKYSVKIRGHGMGGPTNTHNKSNADISDIHWSAKKRFIPNGNIQNFTPEFKPYRRPSYNAFLQAIKDRDQRDDTQLEQFQRDRKHYAKLHAQTHLNRLKQQKLQEQVTAEQRNTQSQMPTIRGPNQSRSRHLFQQQMYANQMGINPNLLQQSPINSLPVPSVGQSPMDNINNILRNINVSATPPIIPFNQQLLINPNNANQSKKLSATTAPWTGVNMQWKTGQNKDESVASSRGTSPMDMTKTAPTQSSTATPQMNNMNTNDIPSISLTHMPGTQTQLQQTVTPKNNVSKQQSSNTAKINLMNLPNASVSHVPIQFSRGLYQRNQQNQQNQQMKQQILQQQQHAQQRQAMLNAQAQAQAQAQQQQQQRQGMINNNIWRNKQQSMGYERQWSAPGQAPGQSGPGVYAPELYGQQSGSGGQQYQGSGPNSVQWSGNNSQSYAYQSGQGQWPPGSHVQSNWTNQQSYGQY